MVGIEENEFVLKSINFGFCNWPKNYLISNKKLKCNINYLVRISQSVLKQIIIILHNNYIDIKVVPIIVINFTLLYYVYQ